MASIYAFRNRPRSEQVYTFEFTTTIVASTTTHHTIDLPPGSYRMAMTLTTVGNANNSVALNVYPFADLDQSAVGLYLGLMESSSASTAATGTITHAAASAKTSYAFVSGSAQAQGAGLSVQVMHGVRLTGVTGAGVAAGTYTIRFMAVED